MDTLTETNKVNLERLDIFLRHTLGQTREESIYLLTKLIDKYKEQNKVINWQMD